MTSDPHHVLGVDPSASIDEIRERRRHLAAVHHPDVGGNAETMSAINRAFDEIVALRSATTTSDSSSHHRQPQRHAHGTQAPEPRRFDVDRPSFVIDALPVVAFEVLLLAARSLGDIADEDPPYVIEMQLEDPPLTWCRLEIVPDAGSSTVSIITDGRVSAEHVRDLWIATVNELDIRLDD